MKAKAIIQHAINSAVPERRLDRCLVLSAALMACLLPGPAIAAECDLPEAFEHETHEGVRTILGDGSALAFATNMRVNTDGAPRSYHPDDPAGATLALNKMCHGANAKTVFGRTVNYEKCNRFNRLFEKARDANWTGWNKPKIEFFAVATKPDGTPCINTEAPNEGYFVSTTSVLADASITDVCDQKRYLDSTGVPFAIYPPTDEFTARGLGRGDLAAFYNPKENLLKFALIGDAGPKLGLAEGSIALAAQLQKDPTPPANVADVYGFGVPEVFGVFFPNASLAAPYTADTITAGAKGVFEEWGGLDRLIACGEALPF